MKILLIHKLREIKFSGKNYCSDLSVRFVFYPIKMLLTSVAAITEQHLLWVCLTPADPALGVHDGLGPDHRVVQGGQVEEELAHSGAGHQARLPPLERGQGRLLKGLEKTGWPSNDAGFRV